MSNGPNRNVRAASEAPAPNDHELVDTAPIPANAVYTCLSGLKEDAS